MTFADKLRGCWRSLTIWFNTTALAIVAGLPMLQDSIPSLQQYMPDDAFRWIGGAVVLANIALRFKTRTALEYK